MKSTCLPPFCIQPVNCFLFRAACRPPPWQLTTLLMLFLCPPSLVFSAVGVGYPMYASLKMLAEDTTEDAAMWITYWCLFTCFKIVMGPLDFVLGFLPFYFYLKLAMLVWLFSPTSKGAGIVYDKVVKPYVFPLLVGTKSD